MSLTVFGKKNFRGNDVRVNANQRDMRNTSLNYRGSSVQMNRSSDRALFFTERDYQGEVMFRRGVNNISNLGDPSSGGKNGFNNDVRSIRRSCFTLNLKYHFVHDGGDLPGDDYDSFLGFLALAATINDINDMVIDILEPFMLSVEKDPLLGVHDNGVYFNIDRTVSPTEYESLRVDPALNFSNEEINIVFVNSITNAIGIATHNLSTPVVLVTLRRDNDKEKMARTTAHEVCHYLGLGHGANTDPNNLMTQTGVVSAAGVNPLDATELTDAQVEEIHETLAQIDDMGGVNFHRIRRE